MYIFNEILFFYFFGHLFEIYWMLLQGFSLHNSYALPRMVKPTHGNTTISPTKTVPQDSYYTSSKKYLQKPTQAPKQRMILPHFQSNLEATQKPPRWSCCHV